MPNRRLLDWDEYVQLKRAQAFLQALQAGGVDNWDWYSEAYRDYIKQTRGKDWAEPADEDDNEEEI